MAALDKFYDSYVRNTKRWPAPWVSFQNELPLKTAMKKPKHRFVDLSIFLENDVLSDPSPLAPKITYQKHADTLPEFMAMIPGTTSEDYPDGEAAAAEWVTLTTHNALALSLHPGRKAGGR
jgi:hypothetical protein